MTQTAMTMFSQQLGGFFAGSVSLAALERSADKVVADDVDIENALGLIDMHRDAGRLNGPLHRILHDRLTQRFRSAHGDDNTAPLADLDEPTSPIAGIDEPTAPQSGIDEATAPVAGLDEPTAAISGLDERTAPLAGANELTAPLPGASDVTAPIAGKDDVTASFEGADAFKPPITNADELAAVLQTKHAPTEQINKHIAPTERIHQPGDPTEKINQHVESTYQITQKINAHVAPTEQINSHVDRTEKIERGTQPLHSSQYPSQRLRTGSNWLHPDQWTERHTGPLGPGVLLKQRFMIESQLGRGGMGVVFKARDQRKEEAKDRDPYVAIKVLNDTFREHPQALIALQREARKAQTLAHPNIITVYDFDRDGTRVFMTMELMRGEPLDTILRKHKNVGLDVEKARTIIKEMAAGLSYAHKQDIIHSDFKPGNVFLTEDDRVKILDFGIARATAYSGNDTGDVTLFDAGDLGSLTPAYASYEMFNKGAPHPADDVYALAIAAYMLFTGKHPFDRKNAEQVLEMDLQPEPIKAIARHEWQAIAHGLAVRRDDRTYDAATFLAEFRGPQRASKFAGIVIAALFCVAVYFAYASFQDRGPAIDWSELTVAQQTAFSALVESGNQWLQNDPPWIGGAYNDFAEAYVIHPRNPDAVIGLDRVAESLIALADSAESPDAQRRLLSDIKTASANEYLAEHRQLRRIRKRLEQSVEAAP